MRPALGLGKCDGRTVTSVSAYRSRKASRVARGRCPVGAGDRAPGGNVALDHVVHQVAAQQRLVTARGDVQTDLARGMAGQRRERYPVLDPVVHLDQQLALGVQDRDHAVGDVVAGAGHQSLFGLGQPEIELGAGEDVLGVGEGRHPAAVLQPGVPADMIDVQMGAQHEIDVFRTGPGRQGTGPSTGTGRREELPVARLVIADAAIHQDGVAGRLDQEGLDRDHDQPGVGSIVPRHHPFGMRGDRGLVPIGKERPWPRAEAFPSRRSG